MNKPNLKTVWILTVISVFALGTLWGVTIAERSAENIKNNLEYRRKVEATHTVSADK